MSFNIAAGVPNPFGFVAVIIDKLGVDDFVTDQAAKVFAMAANVVISMSKTVLAKVFLFIDDTTEFTIGTTTDTGAKTPLHDILPYTLYIGLSVAVIMAFWTLVSAGVRRDARQIGQLLIGMAQYAIVLGAFMTVLQGVNVLCDAASQEFLTNITKDGGGDTWIAQLGNQDLLDDKSNGEKSGDIIQALGVMFVMAFFALISLFFGIILYLELAMRQVAILLLVATAPIAAVGLLRGSTASWFKKLCMWTFSLLLMKPAASLILWMAVLFLSNAQGLSGIIGGMGALALACAAPFACMRLLTFADSGSTAMSKGSSQSMATSSGSAVGGGVSKMSGASAASGASAGADSASGDSGAGSGGSATSGQAASESGFASRIASAVPAAGPVVGGAVNAVSRMSDAFTETLDSGDISQHQGGRPAQSKSQPQQNNGQPSTAQKATQQQPTPQSAVGQSGSAGGSSGAATEVAEAAVVA